MFTGRDSAKIPRIKYPRGYMNNDTDTGTEDHGKTLKSENLIYHLSFMLQEVNLPISQGSSIQRVTCPEKQSQRRHSRAICLARSFNI